MLLTGIAGWIEGTLTSTISNVRNKVKIALFLVRDPDINQLPPWGRMSLQVQCSELPFYSLVLKNAATIPPMITTIIQQIVLTRKKEKRIGDWIVCSQGYE